MVIESEKRVVGVYETVEAAAAVRPRLVVAALAGRASS
jgi:hypothetical protein